jgi:hypothetical protein
MAAATATIAFTAHTIARQCHRHRSGRLPGRRPGLAAVGQAEAEAAPAVGPQAAEAPPEEALAARAQGAVAPAAGPVAPAAGPVAPAAGPVAPAAGPVAPAAGLAEAGRRLTVRLVCTRQGSTSPHAECLPRMAPFHPPSGWKATRTTGHGACMRTGPGRIRRMRPGPCA